MISTIASFLLKRMIASPLKKPKCLPGIIDLVKIKELSIHTKFLVKEISKDIAILQLTNIPVSISQLSWPLVMTIPQCIRKSAGYVHIPVANQLVNSNMPYSV